MADLFPVYKDIDGVRTKMVAYKDIDGVRTKISSAEDDSIVGTWVFNDTISLVGFPGFSPYSYGESKNTFSITFNSNSGGHPYSFTSFQTARPNTSSPYELLYSNKVVWKGTGYTSLTLNTSGGYTDLWKTVVITEDVTDSTFKTWLKANATKQ